MGSSDLNFKNFGTDMPPGNFPLARQSSVYSLTFEEFQNTVGGIGKDFGSMNMDELLKNIWSAEENQNIGSTSGGDNNGGWQEGSGYLQRQGSLTLPRTLSQKTVDEVWRDMVKEYGGGGSGGGQKDPACGDTGGLGVLPPRQPTLGEVTLEEFLVRAGVVKEETQLDLKPNNAVDLFSNLSRPVNSFGSDFGYPAGIDDNSNQIANNLPVFVNGVRSAVQQQPVLQAHPQQQQLIPKQPTLAYPSSNQLSNPGIRGGIADSSNQIANNVPLNGNGARSAAQQQQQHLLPKQPALAYPSSNQLSNPGIRGGIIGISDPAMNDAMVQNTMVGLGGNGVISVTTGSPAVSSDGLTKSNGDTSSVSPVPYVFNGGGLRGRKSAALEKVVERRQRRMIKNRESAARSRARKQAYTTELEAEVAKLKEENELLEKKQAEMLEMQKNQVLAMKKQENGNKRRCLRRTQTGPW